MACFALLHLWLFLLMRQPRRGVISLHFYVYGTPGNRSIFVVQANFLPEGWTTWLVQSAPSLAARLPYLPCLLVCAAAGFFSGSFGSTG